jgi:PEP-CTERM motif
MRRYFSVAATLVLGTLLFVQPSKADTINTYHLTGHGYDITFSLPTIVAASMVEWNGVIDIANVEGTFHGAPFTFARVQLGPVGYAGLTNYWAFGWATRSIQFALPDIYTKNSDGTYTLNVGAGTFAIGDSGIARGGARDYTLTIVDPPVGSVPTPEPASMVLVGIGGLVLGITRRRKQN